MTKIDLSKYDFKDVLEWVCDRFPDNDILEHGNPASSYLICGYAVKNNLCRRSIGGADGAYGLRDVVERMTRIVKKEDLPDEFISITDQNGRFYTLKSLAQALEPYLENKS